MAFRRIDITLPPGYDFPLESLEDLPILDTHVRPHAEDGRPRLVLLCREDSTEPILEHLDQLVGEVEGFRAVVIPLSAILPRPDEEEEKQQIEAAAQQDDRHALAKNRISRDELLNDLHPGTQVTWTYMITVLLSSIIATIGMVRDNTAVVIGAMVIAPLLLPNMSLALATTLGDWKMMARSLWTNAAGVALCLGFAVGFGAAVPFNPEVQEIASRTDVRFSDVALALAAGTAGAIAVTSGVSANLIGVMVAVALLPPLAAFGLLLGGGSSYDAMMSGLLAGTNVACVNLAAVATFFVRGIRPGSFSEKEQAKRATLGAFAVWVLAVAATVFLIWYAGTRSS